MSNILATAKFELLSLSRDGGPRLMIGIFLAMMAISSLIGLLTNLTVSDVWQTISQQGLTVAPNPFQDVSVLYYARNSVIYIILIGGLAAIISGVTSGLRDRQAHSLDMILTRQISTRGLLLGKLLGVSAWLTIALGAALSLIGIVLSLIAQRPLDWSEIWSLVALFAAGLPLLAGFAGIGLIFGVTTRRESTALVSPIAIWALITFVFPQLGTAARPIALLNPVSAVATNGGPFDLLNAVFSPVAFVEQFKNIAASLLDVTSSAATSAGAAISLIAFLGLVFVLLMLIKRDQIRGVVND
jgi:ABC-2 type transport system permease protein